MDTHQINYQNWCKICNDTQINNVVLNGVFILRKQKYTEQHIETLQPLLQNNDISLSTLNNSTLNNYVDIRIIEQRLVVARENLYIQEAKDLKKKIKYNYELYGRFAPEGSYMIYFDISSAYSYLKIHPECNILHIFNDQEYRINTLKLLWQMSDSKIIFNVIMEQITNFLLHPYQNKNNFFPQSTLNQIGLSQSHIDQIQIVRSIDDFLIFSQSYQLLKQFSLLFQKTFQLLNIQINKQKSITRPTKKLTYLQYHLDTTEQDCYIYSRYNSRH